MSDLIKTTVPLDGPERQRLIAISDKLKESNNCLLLDTIKRVLECAASVDAPTQGADARPVATKYDPATQPGSPEFDGAEAFEAHIAAENGDMNNPVAIDRYRVERTHSGFWPYKVMCGNGTRELFKGHKTSCERVAFELQTAFLDGAFAATHGAKP